MTWSEFQEKLEKAIELPRLTRIVLGLTALGVLFIAVLLVIAVVQGAKESRPGSLSREPAAIERECFRDGRTLCEPLDSPRALYLCLKLQEERVASTACRRFLAGLPGLEYCAQEGRRLCPNAAPGAAFMTCLRKHRAESPGCRAFLRGGR